MGMFRVDAKNIAAAATQTVSAGFIATHDNKPVLLLTGDSIDRTSDATTPIQAGVKDGQTLTIIAIASNTNLIKIQDAGNCVLGGDWKALNLSPLGTSLTVVWSAGDSKWYEVNRGLGGNTTSGLMAVALGWSNTASGQNAISGGSGCVSSGVGSVGFGRQCNATNSQAMAFGNECDATGATAFAHGTRAKANQSSQYAHAGGRFTTDGDAQYSRVICRRAVTPDSGGDIIGVNDTAIGPVIAADTVWTFRADIVGTSVDGGSVSSAIIEGCIKSAGTTVSMPTVQATNVIHADDADIVFTAVADDTNKSLNIVVTDATNGAVAYRFVATIHVTQITFT